MVRGGYEKCLLLLCTQFTAVLGHAQYAQPDHNSPFYNRQGEQISIGQAMDCGGTVRTHKTPKGHVQTVTSYGVVTSPAQEKQEQAGETKKWVSAVLWAASQIPQQTTVEEGECAKWHSEKERDILKMESAYEMGIETLSEMKLWGGLAPLIRYGSIGVAQVLGSVRPEISLGVSAMWLARDAAAGEYSDREASVDNVERTIESVADGLNGEIGAKIARYEKAARTKNKGVIAKLEGLKEAGRNAAAGATSVGLGATFVQYGFAQDAVEDKYKSSLVRLEEAKRKIELLKNRTCPICGRR